MKFCENSLKHCGAVGVATPSTGGCPQLSSALDRAPPLPPEPLSALLSTSCQSLGSAGPYCAFVCFFLLLFFFFLCKQKASRLRLRRRRTQNPDAASSLSAFRSAPLPLRTLVPFVVKSVSVSGNWVRLVCLLSAAAVLIHSFLFVDVSQVFAFIIYFLYVFFCVFLFGFCI